MIENDKMPFSGSHNIPVGMDPFSTDVFDVLFMSPVDEKVDALALSKIEKYQTTQEMNFGTSMELFNWSVLEDMKNENVQEQEGGDPCAWLEGPEVQEQNITRIVSSGDVGDRGALFPSLSDQEVRKIIETKGRTLNSISRIAGENRIYETIYQNFREKLAVTDDGQVIFVDVDELFVIIDMPDLPQKKTSSLPLQQQEEIKKRLKEGIVQVVEHRVVEQKLRGQAGTILTEYAARYGVQIKDDENDQERVDAHRTHQRHHQVADTTKYGRRNITASSARRGQLLPVADALSLREIAKKNRILFDHMVGKRFVEKREKRKQELMDEDLRKDIKTSEMHKEGMKREVRNKSVEEENLRSFYLQQTMRHKPILQKKRRV